MPIVDNQKRYKTPSREPNNSLRGGVGEDEVSALFVAQTQFAVALFLSPFSPVAGILDKRTQSQANIGKRETVM